VLVDSKHRPWAIATTLVLAVATGLYTWYAAAAPHGPTGGSGPGLLFALAGSGLMVYAGLLGLRKRVPRWPIGSAQTWLRGHIWLGSLSVPLILFHAGFGWGGPLEQWLWGVLAAIIVSGVYGLVVQQIVPRAMSARVPLETFADQVPHVCGTLQTLADEALEDARHIAAEANGAASGSAALTAGCERLVELHAQTIQPYLGYPSARASPLSAPDRAEQWFADCRSQVPQQFQNAIDRLEECCQERRQLAVQERLHGWLHGWLHLHVPLALALLVLGVIHAVMSLYR
jgi:hypothetical protein